MIQRRYLGLIGLLAAAVLLWQFGVHEGWNPNPLDDPADTQSAATLTVAEDARLRAAQTARWSRSSALISSCATDEPSYSSEQVMLRTVDGAAAEQVAAEYGGSVVRPAGASGFATLSVPSQTTRDDLLWQLRGDPRVDVAMPVGLVYGADDDDHPSCPRDYQWHLESVGHPVYEDDDETLPDFGTLVVAVLDTGVAYEDHSDALGDYVQAPSLADTLIVAPYDFVNGDEHANDDHQHGTHIATLIAGQDTVEGIAPGVAVMPIKVLDANNSGTEVALVDAIWHAIDHGADVINMSLSFQAGYLLSPALDEALQSAWDSGIVVLAAAGNDGADYLTYPAAHTAVVAIGATRMKDDDGKVEEVDYTNRHPSVDLVAPGGDVGADEDENGVPDGMLSETIALNDPSTIAYMLYAGTSQATAVSSGAACWLLAAGASADETVSALQLGADNLGSEWVDGNGQGRLRIREADKKFDEGKARDLPVYYVAIMPYLKDSGDEIEPKAEITVLDETGELVGGVDVYVVFSGASEKIVKCGTSGDGRCEVKAPKVDRYDDSGQEMAHAWSITAATCKKDNIGTHPRTAFFAPDALEILLAAAGATDGLAEDAALAFHWPELKDPDFGEMVESYFLVDTGSGLGSCPLGVIFTRPVLGNGDDEAEFAVDLDGTGLGSCPLGTVLARRFTLDGTGLGSCPLGNVRLPIFAFDGSGLGSCPLGFRPPQVFTGLGQSYDSSLVSLEAAPVLLGSGDAWSTADLAGSSVGMCLDTGDLFTAEGYASATAFIGSGNVAGTAGSGASVTGMGAGTVPFVP